MIKHFLNLEFKQFVRSASLGKSIALKIIMLFFALYLMVSFLFLGIALYPGIKKLFPDQDPLVVVNNFLVFWILFELVFRYFMQKIPVLNIKPLLIQSVSKSKITHYVLAKSALSFFNVLPLFWIVPFAITLIVKNHDTTIVLGWGFMMLCLVLLVNYINVLVNKINAVLISVVSVLSILIALEYYDVFKVSKVFGAVFNGICQNPVLCIIPFVVLVGVYVLSFKYIKSVLFLDASLKTKVQEAKTQDLSWTKNFGEVAPFLQLDLKLIWRNKRPRMTVILALVFLLYGLMFYNNDTFQSMYVFAGIFITGMFVSNFGQFIPAWDSSYYSMMMAQNIPMRKYLDSKAILLTASVVVCLFLSIPYVYFGYKILAINIACALYNIGVNIPAILWISAYNKKRIDLEKSPMMNYEGMGAAQWIMIIPFLLVPLLIYGASKAIANTDVAIIILGVFGVIGIVFRNFIFNKITNLYQAQKYGMIQGFKQN